MGAENRRQTSLRAALVSVRARTSRRVMDAENLDRRLGLQRGLEGARLLPGRRGALLAVEADDARLPGCRGVKARV